MSDNLKITFVNVGYGEAILIEYKNTDANGEELVMIIDGGSADLSEFENRSSGRIPLEEYIKKYNIKKIDAAISTHIHEDHISGMLLAAQICTPRVFYQSLPSLLYKELSLLDVSRAENLSQKKFMTALNDNIALCSLVEKTGGEIRALVAGDAFTVADRLKIRVLSPIDDDAELLIKQLREVYSKADAPDFLKYLDYLDARMNNYSLILKLEYNGISVLLPGDTNLSGYSNIAPDDLRADIFKIGHHGQIDGADSTLLEAIKPVAVVCCASSDRRYNSAHPDTMRLIAKIGAQAYFSDTPQVEGIKISPHEALEFVINENGNIDVSYIFNNRRVYSDNPYPNKA